MHISFGKHAGKSVELLMLKEPDYIKWLLDQRTARGSMAAVRTHINKLIGIFDAMPFKGKTCFAQNCNNGASRFSVYLDSLDPWWWCSTCDPYQAGAPHGNLQFPVDYKSALRHVELYCRHRKSDYKELIKIMSQAKGCPKRVGEAQATKFFA